MKTFKEILKAKIGVDLAFVDVLQDESVRDGSQIVKLVLKDPIGVVYGRKITDRVSDEVATLQANDVEMVSLGTEILEELDALEAAGTQVFFWDEGKEGKSGTLKCPFKLDVSAALDVWVVKTSLAQFGRNRRNEAQARRTSNVVNKINEAKAKREFKNTDVSGAPAMDANDAAKTGAAESVDSEAKPAVTPKATPAGAGRRS